MGDSAGRPLSSVLITPGRLGAAGKLTLGL